MSPEPLLARLTPIDDEPIFEPPRASARAKEPGVPPSPDFQPEETTPPRARQAALPLTSAVGLPMGSPTEAGNRAAETLLEAGRSLWRAIRDPLLRPDVKLVPALVARLRNTGTHSYDPSSGYLVLEGSLLPEDLEEPVLVQSLAVAAGGQPLVLQLASSASLTPRQTDQLPSVPAVDDPAAASDTRSPEERWVADRDFLVSKGVPEERLRRIEYDMLGASHCEACQTVALEESAPAVVVSGAVVSA